MLFWGLFLCSMIPFFSGIRKRLYVFMKRYAYRFFDIARACSVPNEETFFSGVISYINFSSAEWAWFKIVHLLCNITSR